MKFKIKNPNEPYYMTYCPTKCCGNCKYRHYDSFHGETWCEHKPPPNGLGSALLIDMCGYCEYWEDTDYDPI